MKTAKLHYITQEIEQRSHLDNALLALKGGVKWVQLRVKDKPEKEVFEIAEELKILCQQFGSKLIINDYLEIAADLRLDGIHLGLTDTSTKVAREKLGKAAIIGGTANTLDDVLYHYNNGVDYVGLGPFRFTATKNNLSPIVGMEKYMDILQQLKARDIQLPLIAIGGIQIEDLETIIHHGIHGVALASLINLDTNPTKKMQEIINKIENVSC